MAKHNQLLRYKMQVVQQITKIIFFNKKTTGISLIHQFSSFCTGSKPATNSRQFIDTQARITAADKIATHGHPSTELAKLTLLNTWTGK